MTLPLDGLSFWNDSLSFQNPNPDVVPSYRIPYPHVRCFPHSLVAHTLGYDGAPELPQALQLVGFG